MRIGFDGRLLLRPLRGMAVYINNVFHELISTDSKNEFRMYVDTHFAYNAPPKTYAPVLDAFKKYPNFSIVDINASNAFQWEQICLPKKIREERLDILHMPANRAPFLCPAKKMVVTVHDMIEMIFFKEYFRTLRGLRGRFYDYRVGLYITFMYKKIFPRADMIITDSEHSRHDIHRITGTPLAKIKVSHLAQNAMFKKLDVPREDYLLSFGSVAIHKNCENVLRAFAALPEKLKRTYKLLMIGKTPQLETLAKELGEKNIVFQDADFSPKLVETFNKALGFVFASHYEGFGIPPVEAMACGTPVIASTASSVPEVVGDAALLVNPADPTQIRDAMEKILSSETTRQKLSDAGLKRVQLFSWKKAADIHRELFAQIME
ncbi:glycosyltransferase family 4 protein [bacterium]|nr:glycosyltransferase family 4 protein [bacterium]